MNEPFSVGVVFCTESERLAARIRSEGATAIPDAPVIDGCGNYGFTVTTAVERSLVIPSITQARREASACLVVSDGLVSPRSGNYTLTPFATDLRDWFNDQEGLAGGLLALVEGNISSTADILGMVNCQDKGFRTRLCDEMRRASDGLWLKSKLQIANHFDEDDAIQVRLASREVELREAFQLRHRVYQALGYLDAAIIDCGTMMEVDQFDDQAFHFVAVDRKHGEVVGAVRLILKPNRDASQARKQQQKFVAEVIRDEPLLRERFNANASTPFPLLENSNFEDKWPEFLRKYPPREGGELSRLVVAPRFRGMGISTLLVRQATATAVALGKKYLMLECVPQHVAMYERHGFRSLADHRIHNGKPLRIHNRDLDQLAVGMYLDLSPSDWNVKASLASHDLAMLDFTTRSKSSTAGFHGFLCQCRTTSCWEKGFYLERGKALCPLKSVLKKSTSSKARAEQ